MEFISWWAKQFSNLLDPGTALGAFLISCIASCVCSFIGGAKWKEYTIKENIVNSEKINGSIYQDVHRQTKNNEKNIRKVSKSNEIKVKEIKGNIWQDSEK